MTGYPFYVAIYIYPGDKVDPEISDDYGSDVDKLRLSFNQKYNKVVKIFPFLTPESNRKSSKIELKNVRKFSVKN